MAETVVDRLHRCLVRSLREKRPDPPGDQPVTVAEIYQHLVPYREVRSDIGVELNADYEHALLRLLAGEGGYVRLDPEAAMDALRRELESTHPNVGMFRKFAACDAWIQSNGSAEPAAADVESPSAAPPAEPASSAEPWAYEGPDTLAEPEPTVQESRERGPGPERADAADRSGSDCAFCGSSLPEGRPVRYCPHCGEDQARRPCDACGETLDASWRFCVACGHRVARSGA